MTRPTRDTATLIQMIWGRYKQDGRSAYREPQPFFGIDPLHMQRPNWSAVPPAGIASPEAFSHVVASVQAEYDLDLPFPGASART